MRKEQFKELCKEFRDGNTSPLLPQKLGIEMSEFTQILKAYRETEYCEKVFSIMRNIAVCLLQSGIEKEEFMRLTGYTELTTDRMIWKYTPYKENKENKKTELEKICEKFGLEPTKTLKEQLF